MKLEARIKWVIDDSILGIESDRIDTVFIDIDYVKDVDEDSINELVENELAKKYRILLEHDEDFVIVAKNYSFSIVHDDEDFVTESLKDLIKNL